MIPFELKLKILVAIDRSVFDEVCLGTVILTEFYTISRGELLPTSQTAESICELVISRRKPLGNEDAIILRRDGEELAKDT